MVDLSKDDCFVGCMGWDSNSTSLASYWYAYWGKYWLTFTEAPTSSWYKYATHELV